MDEGREELPFEISDILLGDLLLVETLRFPEDFTPSSLLGLLFASFFDKEIFGDELMALRRASKDVFRMLLESLGGLSFSLDR